MSAPYDEPKNASVSHHDLKADTDDNVDRHLEVHMPASLSGLTKEELAAVNRRATRKIDILLMPALIALFFLNFLDRNNLPNAKIGGITKTLGMTDSQYATCVAVLFAGYVSLQVPSNMLASKLSHPAIYICVMVSLWGMVSACTAAVHSYAGLAVVRVVLGFTEAVFFPGALYLLSTFYTKEQIALRTAILYSGSQLGNAFGGLFALAILELDGTHGIEGWRWLFIVEGAMTVGAGMLCATFMPNKPSNMIWVSEVERDAIIYRLQADRGTVDAADELPMGRAAWLAVTDPKALLVCLALTIAWVASSVTNFFPIVVQTLNFNRTTTLALTAPPYIFGIICINLNAWHSDKTQERTWHIIVPFIVTLIANLIAMSTLNTGARYFAMMLMPASFYSGGTVLLGWVSSTICGPHTKRAIALAIVNAVSNTSNIWTSYLYFNKPRYIVAFGVNLAAAVLVIVTVLATNLYLRRLNKKLDRGEDLGVQGPTEVQKEAGFRFQL